MRTLFINSIFPNPAEPNKGNFIIKNIAAYPDEVEVRVIAPIPYFLEKRRAYNGRKISYIEHINLQNRKLKVYHPRFILLPGNLIRGLVPFLEYLAIRLLAKKLFKEWKFDIIHANFASPDGISAALIRNELGVPLIITEHQAALQNFMAVSYLKKQIHFAYQAAKRVICVSEHTRNIILQSNPNAEDSKSLEGRLTVIPNGIEIDRFNLRQKQPKPEKLIYIGYLVPHKGVQVLLQSLSILKTKCITPFLSIIGDGSYKAELKKLCQELGLTEQVSFLGEKTSEQVTELLTQHDAMVHPSFIESFGIVLIEALASGLPVVSTFNGGAESIITPETGLLVPINNPQALADGIINLFDNWERFNPQTLRQHVQDKFSQSRVASQTMEVYKQVLCKK